jgi:hypothetical protein
MIATIQGYCPIFAQYYLIPFGNVNLKTLNNKSLPNW